MGSGESGAYYTSGGSTIIHHEAIIHAFDGNFTHNPRTGKAQRLRSGGHGQSSLDLLQRYGIQHHISKTYPNGVRVGSIEKTNYSRKRETGHAWFPSTWTTRDMVRAAEHVMQLKKNRYVPDGATMWGTWRGVRIGVKRRKGIVVSIFPDTHQLKQWIQGEHHVRYPTVETDYCQARIN
ncbi:EndoU domain-containing protein [Bifidobacterium cuniculi]|uniref:Transposase n=1 Tax=Bifidobacterium cuniculi TaxID=1688 RepID=A0A087APM4_9BIFI|nr:EndoU domain-containing protein [Bifidobacterium cuniculi]KFI60724.1 transposase [Bifidobacterium cuniculi]